MISTDSESACSASASSEDVQRIVAFYREDESSFVFAAERELNQYRPDVDVKGVTAMELKEVQSVEELAALIRQA